MKVYGAWRQRRGQEAGDLESSGARNEEAVGRRSADSATLYEDAEEPKEREENLTR